MMGWESGTTAAPTSLLDVEVAFPALGLLFPDPMLLYARGKFLLPRGHNVS